MDRPVEHTKGDGDDVYDGIKNSYKKGNSSSRETNFSRNINEFSPAEEEMESCIRRMRSNTALKHPSKEFHFKAVGFNLKYTSQKDSLNSEDHCIREIDLERPCKVVIALMLALYLLGEQIYINEIINNEGVSIVNFTTTQLDNIVSTWSHVIQNFPNGFGTENTEELQNNFPGSHEGWSTRCNAWLQNTVVNNYPTKFFTSVVNKYSDWAYSCSNKVSRVINSYRGMGK